MALNLVLQDLITVSSGIREEVSTSQIAEDDEETCPKKASCLNAAQEVEDNEATDVGQCSASETDGASGHSGDEGVSHLCRFGESAYGTVPKTPVGAVASSDIGSPPGLSREAMRRARDARNAAASVELAATESSSDASATESKLCRFDASSYGTVPKTPIGGANFKALKNVIGSPPGLSHTELRKERDALQAAPKWGTAHVKPATIKSAKAVVLRLREDAALLKDLKDQGHTKISIEPEMTTRPSKLAPSAHKEVDAIHDNSEGNRCRFSATPLGTIPSTPVGGVASLASPPGFSRASMRQVRDTCRVPSAAMQRSSTEALLTICPAVQPMMSDSVAPR